MPDVIPVSSKYFNYVQTQLKKEAKVLKYTIEDFEIIPQSVKDKFERYLRMIFNDMCAKDNGLNLKTFGFYTFQKVRWNHNCKLTNDSLFLH